MQERLPSPAAIGAAIFERIGSFERGTAKHEGLHVHVHGMSRHRSLIVQYLWHLHTPSCCFKFSSFWRTSVCVVERFFHVTDEATSTFQTYLLNGHENECNRGLLTPNLSALISQTSLVSLADLLLALQWASVLQEASQIEGIQVSSTKSSHFSTLFNYMIEQFCVVFYQR